MVERPFRDEDQAPDDLRVGDTHLDLEAVFALELLGVPWADTTHPERLKRLALLALLLADG